MKTKLFASALVILLAIALIAAGVPYIEDPNPAAFVDFPVSGGFIVDPLQTQTIIPITSSQQVVIDNPNPLLQFANDKIYVLEPGVRPVINGWIGCGGGTYTWTQISLLIRNGSGGLIPTAASVLDYKVPGTNTLTSFYLIPPRDFQAEDFVGGNPNLQLVVRVNGSSGVFCKVNFEVETK